MRDRVRGESGESAYHREAPPLGCGLQRRGCGGTGTGAGADGAAAGGRGGEAPAAEQPANRGATSGAAAPAPQRPRNGVQHRANEKSEVVSVAERHARRQRATRGLGPEAGRHDMACGRILVSTY